MPTSPNCVIHFVPEAFDAQPQRLFGRHSANIGFWQGLVRHGNLDAHYCCAASPEYFKKFRALLAELGDTRPAHWIPYTEPEKLQPVGCLYQPEPVISDLAWHRARLGSHAFSICGVTHTLSSMQVYDALGAMVLAPLEPWDALVCTSQACAGRRRTSIRRLAKLPGRSPRHRPPSRIELPVIPLGVDCDFFAASEASLSAGAEIRRQLGIGPDEIALLFVGRLSYHAKAHPLPMYLAAEEVARRSGRRLHLLHFGWFANATLKAHFASAARQLCPSVDVHFLDERQDWYQGLWHAADIFMSLSDNIQETFGLSPLEAMAAGLPQIVTDWNGYRDTVRDGLDGFRVPTAMPPPGAGEELATRYALGIDNYDAYVGNASQTVAVDVAGCIAALERLVKNPDLRHSLGESGRRRALAAFDWRIVIPLHQALWLELAARRRAAPSAAATTFSHPLRPDPFRLFAGYASRTLNANCTIELGPQAAPERFRELAAHPMNHFAHAILGSQNEVQSILDAVARAGSLRVGELLAEIPDSRQAVVYRTLGWLAKLDAIRIAGASPAAASR